MREDIKASCLKRLHRIEGQVGGLSRAWVEERTATAPTSSPRYRRARPRCARAEEEIFLQHSPTASRMPSPPRQGRTKAQDRRADGCRRSRRPALTHCRPPSRLQEPDSSRRGASRVCAAGPDKRDGGIIHHSTP